MQEPINAARERIDILDKKCVEECRKVLSNPIECAGCDVEAERMSIAIAAQRKIITA